MCFLSDAKMEQLEVEKPEEGALKYDYEGGLGSTCAFWSIDRGHPGWFHFGNGLPKIAFTENFFKF